MHSPILPKKNFNIFQEDSSKRNSPVTTESQNMKSESHDMATKSHDKASTSQDMTTESQDITTESQTVTTKDMKSKSQDMLSKSQDITTESQNLKTEDMKSKSQDMLSKSQDMPLAKVYVHKRNKAKCKGLFVCLFSCLFWYPGTAFLVDLGKYCIPILILDFFPPLLRI